MAEHENRRVAMTKRLVQEGLLWLLENRELGKISVTELCQEADVNNFLKTLVSATFRFQMSWLSGLPCKRKTHTRSYVLAMQNHQSLTKSSYKSMWKLIERELPDTHVTAHILRHTYITRLFEAGLDIKEVQYLAGHSTVDMTPKVYTHYDRRSQEAQTAEKVREALRAAP